MVLSLTATIFNRDYLLARIPDPTVPTVNDLRPDDTGSFPHRNYRQLDCPTVENYHKLFLQITQVHRPESHSDRNSHAWGDVTCVLFRVNHAVNVELLFTQRCYLDSLQVLWFVDQLDLRLVHTMQFVVIENNLFWDCSELWSCESFGTCLGKLLVGVGERFIVSDDRSQVTLVLVNAILRFIL